MAAVRPQAAVERASPRVAAPPLDQASRDTAAFAVGATKAVVCADGPSRQGQAPAAGVLVQRAAGEKVAFVERGSGVDRQIAATERPHGTLEFTSTPALPASARSSRSRP